MALFFHKYCCAGNDFILMEESQARGLGPADWKNLCQRSLGVGADGVVLLGRHPWRMRYFNADGGEAPMCGNGLRALAYHVGEVLREATWPVSIEVSECLYRARKRGPLIEVNMPWPRSRGGHDLGPLYPRAISSLFVDTGVAHSVFEVDHLEGGDFLKLAPGIRSHPMFPEGSNVDFYAPVQRGRVRMRTFERGVEGETLSCATGALAVGVAYLQKEKSLDEVLIEAPGGAFELSCRGGECWLAGPTCLVYEGRFNL